MKRIFVVLFLLTFSFSCKDKLRCSVDDVVKTCKKACYPFDWNSIFISEFNLFGNLTPRCQCRLKEVEMK